MSSGKLKLHNLESFIFKIVVLNLNYSKASVKHFYVISMWPRVFSFFSFLKLVQVLSPSKKKEDVIFIIYKKCLGSCL